MIGCGPQLGDCVRRGSEAPGYWGRARKADTGRNPGGEMSRPSSSPPRQPRRGAGVADERQQRRELGAFLGPGEGEPKRVE